jgi:hypothetical protein
VTFRETQRAQSGWLPRSSQEITARPPQGSKGGPTGQRLGDTRRGQNPSLIRSAHIERNIYDEGYPLHSVVQQRGLTFELDIQWQIIMSSPFVVARGTGFDLRS